MLIALQSYSKKACQIKCFFFWFFFKLARLLVVELHSSLFVGLSSMSDEGGLCELSVVHLINWSVFSETGLTWSDVGHKILVTVGLTGDDSTAG